MSRPAKKSWPSWLASIVILTILALVSAPFAWYVYACRDTTPRGPLIGSSNWPEPIRDLHAAMVNSGIDVEPFEVYLIQGRPGDTISTVICRMPASVPAFEFLKAKLGMQTLPADKKDYAGFVKREITRFAPPDWSTFAEENAEYLASRGILEGDEGDLYLVAHDPAHDRLFLHYYFNF